MSTGVAHFTTPAMKSSGLVNHLAAAANELPLAGNVQCIERGAGHSLSAFAALAAGRATAAV